jgi:hypothetical protein
MSGGLLWVADEPVKEQKGVDDNVGYGRLTLSFHQTQNV